MFEINLIQFSQQIDQRLITQMISQYECQHLPAIGKLIN